MQQQWSEVISQLHSYSSAQELIGDARYCGICGATVFHDKQAQHQNYHATIQRILDELAKFAVTPAATAWNGWLDLDNLRNGDLT